MNPNRSLRSEQFWIGVLSGNSRGAGFSALRAVLAVLSATYCIGLEVYLAAEKIGLRRRVRLAAPVISVGNLTSGGTGKTPMTHLVATWLMRDKMRPAILSRGHGGSESRGPVQVSDQAGAVMRTPAEVGDEAVALAVHSPGVPVFVGKDRRLSGALASKTVHPDVFVLDDGLQYWQLARDLDVVLVDARRPFDNGHALPRGLLREPMGHLRRAGIVVVTRAELAAPDRLDRTVRQIERLAPKASVFLAHHVFDGLRPLNSAAQDRLPQRALAVCGIAQPDSFLQLLKASGIPLTPDMVALGDHAVYDERVTALLKGKITDQDADSLVTTEKDAVKLRGDDFDVPVYAVVLRMEIEKSHQFWSEVLQRAGLAASAGRDAQ